MERFNVAVIGAGTAGLTAATTARARGLSVALIEEDRVGGENLWRGCVPTKSLIECSRIFHQTHHVERFGTEVEGIHLNYPHVQARKYAIMTRIAKDMQPETYERRGVRLYQGHAMFESPHELRVDDKVIRAEQIVLASGAEPLIPPIPGLDQIDYLTHQTAIALPELPKSLLILGGGVIGCELAQMFCRLGVEVTIVEAYPTILYREDPDVVALMTDVLLKEGVSIFTNAPSVRAAQQGARQMLVITRNDHEERVYGDHLLVATGRAPHLADLALDVAGIKLNERGRLVVSPTLQTSVPHIWACGDVVGKYFFNHVAEYQGRHVGANLGIERPRAISERVVPRNIYLEPEIAVVGITEQEAAGRDLIVTRADFAASHRAMMMDETVGFAKIIVDRATGEFLGGHIVGPRAGELIHEISLAMTGNIPVEAVADMIHVYPTLTAPVHEAAREAAALRARFSGEQRRVA